MRVLVVMSKIIKRGNKRVEREAEPADTPDAFLKALGESLKGTAFVQSNEREIVKWN